MANKRINELDRLNEKPATGDLIPILDVSDNTTKGVPYGSLNPNVSTTSLEVSSSNNGLILRSPDNSRWLIRIDNSGTLTRTKI